MFHDMLNWRELSKGCVKGMLIGLNVICILTAMCTFGFAVVDTKILKQYGEEHASGSLRGDVIIILICMVLVVIAVLGCIGAVRDSVKILNMYVICILVLVVMELLVAIYVSVQRYGLQYTISEWLREDFYSNFTDDASLSDHEKMWDELQSSYSCCGLNGPEDYKVISLPIPMSCCVKAYHARTATSQADLYEACIKYAIYYFNGCEGEILDMLKSDADWLFGVVVICFWFEALGMLLAMWVANYVKNSVQVYKNTVKY